MKKRDPKAVSAENRSYCDEVVGNDQYDRVVKEADFVVGLLPGVPGVTENFFTMKSTFRKMKKTAVFMNIGRGACVNEDDLIKALNKKIIAGAALDVFKKEPLDKSSGLWKCENVLITPHCADQDAAHLHRALATFGTNLERWVQGGEKMLQHHCDKRKGY